MEEFVIINKTAIQKRIEELKGELDNAPVHNPGATVRLEKEIEVLTDVLCQSVPLVPEIEKAFDAGRNDNFGEVSHDGGDTFVWENTQISKQDYIEYLKYCFV